MPDQDVLNALYGARILPLEDLIWNYDPRNYSEYKLHSHGKADTRWVIQNTAVLHFCGRDKPWKKATAAASVRCTCTICTWQTGCCPPERAQRLACSFKKPKSTFKWPVHMHGPFCIWGTDSLSLAALDS